MAQLDEELKTRITDRYDMEELIEVLGLTIEDLIFGFEDKLIEALESGVLDVTE